MLHGTQPKNRGRVERFKQDERRNHFLLLPSASHQTLGWQLDAHYFYPGVIRVSAQHCSRIWSQLLIPLRGEMER